MFACLQTYCDFCLSVSLSKTASKYISLTKVGTTGRRGLSWYAVECIVKLSCAVTRVRSGYGAGQIRPPVRRNVSGLQQPSEPAHSSRHRSRQCFYFQTCIQYLSCSELHDLELWNILNGLWYNKSIGSVCRSDSRRSDVALSLNWVSSASARGT